MIPDIKRDLDAVFADNALGEVALTPVGDITGIFDDSEFVTETEYGREVIRRKATFTTKTSHNLQSGDVIVIGGKPYTVRTPIDDGTGVTTYQLETANA